MNAIAVVGIGVLMFAMLKRHNETLALGYLSLRIVEAVFCSLIVVSPLSLIRLGQETQQQERLSILNRQGHCPSRNGQAFRDCWSPSFLASAPSCFISRCINRNSCRDLFGLGLCRRCVDFDIEPAVNIRLGTRHGNQHGLRPPHHLERNLYGNLAHRQRIQSVRNKCGGIGNWRISS